jgi:hypothetical protein
MSVPDPKIFEYIVFDHDVKKDLMLESLDIVKKFIIDNKLIITGGMAIDFALRLKGEKLYDDKTLPDYDFFSPQHHIHAYELGSILCKKFGNLDDPPNISVIDALHITTMKVRINFISVADITYLPQTIFDRIKYLEFPVDSGTVLKFRHPHLQMIDQHRALSFPYENAPREVILHRWKKDMKRFDMLYNKYPIEGDEIDLLSFNKLDIDLSIFENTCIGGVAALYIIKHKKLEIATIGDEPIVIFSYDIVKTISKISDVYKNATTEFYNSYLDNLPPSAIIKVDKVTFQIYDSSNKLIAAEKIKENVWLSGAQYLFSYFLLMNFIKDKQFYKDCYLTLLGMVKGSLIEPITHNVYGNANIGVEHILQRVNHMAQNKEIPRIKVPLKPLKFYPSVDFECKLNANLDHFQYETSPLFQIDAEKVDRRPLKFIEFVSNTTEFASSGEENSEPEN